MKYLLWLAVIALAWWLWNTRRRRPASPPRAVPPASERMLPCAHCGVVQPESEGVHDGARYYCSEAHRRQARGNAS